MQKQAGFDENSSAELQTKDEDKNQVGSLELMFASPDRHSRANGCKFSLTRTP